MGYILPQPAGRHAPGRRDDHHAETWVTGYPRSY
jgi:hypothetical protein